MLTHDDELISEQLARQLLQAIDPVTASLSSQCQIQAGSPPPLNGIRLSRHKETRASEGLRKRRSWKPGWQPPPSSAAYLIQGTASVVPEFSRNHENTPPPCFVNKDRRWGAGKKDGRRQVRGTVVFACKPCQSGRDSLPLLRGGGRSAAVCLFFHQEISPCCLSSRGVPIASPHFISLL